MRIQVSDEDVVTLLLRVLHESPTEEVACLNFTAASSSADSFLGTSYRQEEALLSSSGLFACLRHQSELFDAHRSAGTYLGRSDMMAYSSGVPVFRGMEGKLLSIPQERPHSSARSRCVADRLQYNEPDKIVLIEASHGALPRFRATGGIAAEHGHQTLILGAWGCGGGGNDPNVIAEIFASELVDSHRWDGKFRDTATLRYTSTRRMSRFSPLSAADFLRSCEAAD